jgi:hypothetical protein
VSLHEQRTMATIRPYSSKDYSHVLLFLKSYNPNTLESNWKKLLEYGWLNTGELKGMLIENNNNIEGFLSYIISTTKNSSGQLTYCNLSTWVVNPEFRNKSLALLAKAFDIKNSVILNLSPNVNLVPVFKSLGFQIFSEFEYWANPLMLNYSTLSLKKKTFVDCQKIHQGNARQYQLSDDIEKMIEDHLPYSNVHFYEFTIKSKKTENKLVLAFNQKEKKTYGWLDSIRELPYTFLNKKIQAELLYSNSSDLLSEYFLEILTSFVNKMKIRSVNISEHFLDKKKTSFHFLSVNKKDCPWLFYSEKSVFPSAISILYSEKILLSQ